MKSHGIAYYLMIAGLLLPVGGKAVPDNAPAEGKASGYHSDGVAAADADAGPKATAPAREDRPQQDLPVRSDAEIAQSISRYSERIEAMEAEHGAYHPQLAEEYMGLGLSYSADDEHQKSAEVFERALQISRINSGLHSFDQLPYLENLIQQNKAAGNWEELNNNYQYLFWVHLRNYGDGDPRLLPVIDRITQAQIEVFNAVPDLFTATNLRNREEMIDLAIKIVEKNYGEHDARLVAMLNELILTNYYKALQTKELYNYRRYRQHINSAHRYQLFTTRYVPHVINTGAGPVVTYTPITMPRSDSGLYVSESQSRRFDRIRDAEIKGLEVLKRIETIHEQNPDLPLYSRAAAIVHQGDWRMLYEGRGLQKYKQAYELLNQSEDGKQYIDRLFGQPHALPTLDSLPAEDAPAQDSVRKLQHEATQQDPDPEQPYIEVRFNVSSAGRVRNIDIVESSPQLGESAARTVRWYLGNKRFRPRLVDGKPVMTKNVSIRYGINEHGQLISMSGSRR